MVYHATRSVLPFMSSVPNSFMEAWCIIIEISCQTQMVTQVDMDPSLLCDRSLESYQKTSLNDVESICESSGAET